MVGPELQHAVETMKMDPEVVGNGLEVITDMLVKGCGEKQLALTVHMVLGMKLSKLDATISESRSESYPKVIATTRITPATTS